MRILVLGGYGLIGSAIIRRLIHDGHDVVGLGRSPGTGERLIPQAQWIGADISRLLCADDWAPHLQGMDAVINASGALQDGGRDRLKAVQQNAIMALIDACEAAHIEKFVQISAAGASSDATTDFMRSKAAADAYLKRSALNWTLLRPGLIIARAAYGGTTLIRALSALPGFNVDMVNDSPIQTVSVDDVAEAVSASLSSPAASCAEFDLVELKPHILADIVGAYRHWLGYAKPGLSFKPPRWCAGLAGRLADIGGWLGWRLPLRTTALKVLQAGVSGDGADAERLLGRSALDLHTTLMTMPSNVQDRWHARLTLLYPLILLGLSAFWIASGVIGVISREAAALTLAGTPVESVAPVLVIGGAIADIALGLLLLWRRTSRLAAKGMMALTLIYLVMGSVLTPALWLDPLGALVKSSLLIILPLILHVLLEER